MKRPPHSKNSRRDYNRQDEEDPHLPHHPEGWALVGSVEAEELGTKECLFFREIVRRGICYVNSRGGGYGYCRRGNKHHGHGREGLDCVAITAENAAVLLRYEIERLAPH